MSDFRSAACIVILFALAYPAFRLLRWDRKRNRRCVVEAAINRGLALYLPGSPRIEAVAGVRCLVTPMAEMTLDTTLPDDDACRVAARFLHQLWEDG